MFTQALTPDLLLDSDDLNAFCSMLTMEKQDVDSILCGLVHVVTCRASNLQCCCDVSGVFDVFTAKSRSF